ncbi:hypothetical protein GYMLUDRAFT_1025095 [Collybiopsis luxurians FD-317 M1]|uniref:Unplaced genomic scaffold GYMLUscaffold_77, whole genome shotgun sequence n=1 Tax=Collybiopsis luxurians FD-317 M1 TaxID=944289 RepID=A0A0D0BVK6_9AGAR|nr:hypothetical protein GYMLUDRAFT_1025095 [Collybiopsis luxurians FD-317 M1]
MTLYASSKAALRVYSESLAQELSSQFPGIRVIIVEPSGFRTEQNVLGYPMQIPRNPDPAYDSVREKSMQLYTSLDGRQRGDPEKAVELIVDIVRREGKSVERLGGGRAESPIYVPLGREANNDLEAKCTKMIQVVQKWKDVTDNLDHDDTNSVDLTRWGALRFFFLGSLHAYRAFQDRIRALASAGF